LTFNLNRLFSYVKGTVVRGQGAEDEPNPRGEPELGLTDS